MPNYIRSFIPGGTFFFTVVTNQRASLFSNMIARSLLGNVLRDCQQKWPFEINAIVLLPDHLHAIWSLPQGDIDFSKRWSWVKKYFTQYWLETGAVEAKISTARRSEKRRGIWQPRFWEHAILDENDFERHFDYIHYNPVKHGYVNCPHEWKYSSFHRWVKKGVYSRDWACREQEKQTMNFNDINQSVGE